MVYVLRDKLWANSASSGIDPLAIPPHLASRKMGNPAVLCWRDEIVSVTEYILENGSNDWQTVYKELEEAGWKGRSVSIVKDLVDYFRAAPIGAAKDETATEPPVLGQPSLLRSGEADGRIGVLSDRSGEAIALTVRFPYDNHFLRIVKAIPGRKWNSTEKRWEVPIENAAKVFENFRHFGLSEKAENIKQGLQA